MMTAALTTYLENENLNLNEGANAMTSITFFPPIETPSKQNTPVRRWRDVIAPLWDWLRSAGHKMRTWQTNDLSYEQWNRLEYRNEFAGRIGEKLNPHYLR